MKTIDLDQLTAHGKVQNLSGRVRGLAAREYFNLDEIDKSSETAELHIPGYIYSLTPSFVQGLLGESVRALNNNVAEFRKKYHFVAPAVVLQQLERGISAIVTNRDLENLH